MRVKGGFEMLDGAEFRKRWFLRDDSKIVLIGVGKDRKIESFWRDYRKAIPSLANLNLFGVTVPNFSYFSDWPRPHIMFNRKRSLRVADFLMEHGVAAIPHFNAISWNDWAFWADMLKGCPGLSVFAKEFGTGLKLKSNYTKAITEMADIQQSVGRDLHPIIIAGFKAIDLLTKQFKSFTLIDSTPSMKAKRHHLLKGTSSYQTLLIRAKRSADLASLLDHNILIQTTRVGNRISDLRKKSLEEHPMEKISAEKFLAPA